MQLFGASAIRRPALQDRRERVSLPVLVVGEHAGSGDTECLVGVGAVGVVHRYRCNIHVGDGDKHYRILHTVPMPYLTRASKAGTLRPWLTTAACFPSVEEHDTDATRLYLRSYSPAHHQSAGDHRVLSEDV